MDKELKIFAAPVQGSTEAAWRNAHSKVFGGVDAYYTPFVRVEKGGLRNKDKRELLPENNAELNVIPQIMASEVEEMEFLVDFLISLGYKEIDLNMGCPFPPIANKGKGSGILRYPEKVAALLDCVNSYSVQQGIDFSIKMRLGMNVADEWKSILPLINDSALKMVIIHPRVGKQQYTGDVDMKAFSEFYEQCKKNLVYNGDLCTADDIKRVTEMYPGLYGVMIGRGLLADGSLAACYKSGVGITTEELYRKTKEMHSMIFQWYSRTIEGGEAQLVQKMKSMWEYWLPDMDRKKRKAIHKATKLTNYINAVEAV